MFVAVDIVAAKYVSGKLVVCHNFLTTSLSFVF